MSTLGIDVSVAQGSIDWVRVARWVGGGGERVEFAIVKATEGNDRVDVKCAANSLAADTVGLLLGWYHFAHPDTWHASDPVDEAAHFVETVSALGFDTRRHMLALDIEEARAIAKGQVFHDWVLDFVTHASAAAGAPVWIYTGGPFFNSEEQGIVENAFVEHPLWLAAYVPAPSRAQHVPAPWRDAGCILWQRSGDQAASDCSVLRVDGIAVNVDRDEYEGTIDELRAFIAGKAATDPAPSPTPDPLTHGASTLADESHSLLADLASHEEVTAPGTPTSKGGES